VSAGSTIDIVNCRPITAVGSPVDAAISDDEARVQLDRTLWKWPTSMQSPRIIEIIDDDEQNQYNESLQDALRRVTPSLRIPTAFTNDQWAVQSSGRAMIAWRNSASDHLEELKSIVEKEDVSAFSDADMFSNIIALIVPFTGSGPWAKDESRTISQGPSECMYDVVLTFFLQNSFAGFQNLHDKFSARCCCLTLRPFSTRVHITL
jgi:hypothetical protein